MEPSLTVVLPIHNAERTLRQDVTDVLEAACELTARVHVLVVDDASTDDSFDQASELAREYRQVNVVRRPRRQGLSDTIRDVRASISSDVVIVHDGSSRVNADQLRLIWRQQQVLGAVRDAKETREGVSFADLRRPSITQPAMEVAHRRLWGFQRVAAASSDADERNRRTDDSSAPAPAKRSLGAIPAMPKAKVFGSLADFALGE